LDGEDVPIFSVVIAFEDFDTGRQGKRAYDFLVANLSHEWRVTSQMWKFEVLSIPELREMAASDAASAKLIIISSRGDRELPVDVKEWIELWRGYQGDTVGLITLFHCPTEQLKYAKATQAYLESVARRGHMEFFNWPQAGPGMERRPNRIVVAPRQQTTCTTPFPLTASVTRGDGVSRQGISE
jgi:hypothetical protein